ncbi:MAG: hypothetical protein KF778_10330 [Rhodocyclaceae bacterium]|nr:hypothetical protein [Rhodocyclaceae bacterium]MBX3668787.1 hypothetical protein [Rhodocyclaceae bacterium]
MNSGNVLRFSVSDRINDVEIGPRQVPLTLLGEFQKDVLEFLRGSAREVDPTQVMVSIEPGSLAFVATGLAMAVSLWADLESLRLPDSLGLMDPRRAAVVERWQAAARQNPHRKYRVSESSVGIDFSVDASTAFARAEDEWVQVEKFVHGRVVDWGGRTKANVHLELEDGKMLVVAAAQDLILQEQQNRVYRTALLHITAEENLLSGALRNPRLLAFEAHQPVFDEDEFQQMVSRGTAAWSGFANATEWLEDLRGGAQ